MIQLHHSILRTQQLNWDYRGPANSTNATLEDANAEGAAHSSRSTDAQDYNGTLFNNVAGRRRIVQDVVSTRVLEALLAATVVFSSLAWLLMRNTNLLPRSPTSIASVAALLVDGNLFDFLPEGAENMGDGQLKNVFPHGTVFRLGWGQKVDDTGAVVDRYMVWAIPPVAEDRHEVINFG